jgi:putative two-component system hydrogenase maturation factor HypX/HoxX
LRILLFASAFNGLSQRVYKELILAGHHVSIELSKDPDVMQMAVLDFESQLVICPFLKHRIPDSIWQALPCLVLHPGIIGDKGPSSLDWAVLNQERKWGATLLQANHDFDAGQVWATSLFDMQEKSKASIYRHGINSCAVKMIKQAVALFEEGIIPNIKQNKENIFGCDRPLMKQKVRKINWQIDRGELILKKINAADSFPGVLDEIQGVEYYLFGASFEKSNTNKFVAGEIIGQREESIARATKDGIIWIKQLKKIKNEKTTFQKLPSIRALKNDNFDTKQIPEISSRLNSEIYVELVNNVAYLHFNFYNAAFNTEQCLALTNKFNETARNPEVKVIALMGGDDFWSNGIHLNCIENANNPAKESWLNINAINDFVKSIIDCGNVLTVAALRNNAGAGGAIAPLACDYVIARDGVVLNPHYKTIGLTGSEYWTYLLPARVGNKAAMKLTEECLPILAKEALEINMVDTVFNEDWDKYHQQLEYYCETLASSKEYETLLDAKIKIREQDENEFPLQSYRDEELKSMRTIFNNQDSAYHKLRYNFVHKISCGKTPERLRGLKAIGRKKSLKANSG